MRKAPPAGPRGISPALLALFFAIAVAMHAWLLRLPYFWDEAGYFIPAARDLFLHGKLIPQSTLNNIHPPLTSVYLTVWWTAFGYHVVVTRLAMLLMAAFGLLGVFRLARNLVNMQVAVAVTLLTAVYPVFFAQSSLANLDLAAATFTVWLIERYLAGRIWQSVGFATLAVWSKETAILAPLAIFAWEAFCHLFRDRWPALERVSLPRRTWGKLLIMLFPVLPLLAWIGYHYLRTGWLLGNPEFVQYNLRSTLSATRFALALVQRVWQLLGHMGMLLLTLAAAVSMFFAPVMDEGEQIRPRIPLDAQAVMLAVVVAYLLFMSAVGGAVLARYLLPVFPLVILLFTNTLRRRMREWVVIVVLIAGAFVGGWFWRPPYHYAPEDNLGYADFVRLQQAGEQFLEQKFPHATVLTAWPASDELTRSWLGYSDPTFKVIRVENFTLDNMSGAQHSTAAFDVIFAFSTKYEPGRSLMPQAWREAQQRYFDYHRDLPPAAIAQMFGGQVVWQQSRGGQWAAVIEVPHSFNAKLLPACVRCGKSR